MNLLLLILSAFIIMGFPAFAQNADTGKINLLSKRAYLIHQDSVDIALEISYDILSLSTKSSYLKGEGDACVILGAIFRNLDSFSLSNYYFKRALWIRRTIGDSIKVDAVISNLAINELLQSQYDSAIALTLYSIEMLEDLPKQNHEALGGSYLLLSNIYDEYLESDEAMKYARKSLWSYIKTNNPELIGKASYGLGNRFYLMRQLDSAEYYYNMAFNNFISSGLKNTDYIANIIINKANIFKDKKEFDKSEKLFLEAKEYLDKIGDHADYYYWYSGFADLRIAQQNWPQALENLHRAQAYTEGDYNWLDQKYLYEGLAQTYAALNKMDSAYYYQTAAYAVRDSLYNENKQKVFTRFQTERHKQETLIEQARAQKASGQARLYSQTAVFLSLLLAGLVYVYFQKRRSYRLITRQKEALHQQAVNELLQSSELKYLRAGMEGREAEKEMIGREIHDRLGSAMIALSWQYDAVLSNISPESEEYRHMEKLNESLKSLYHDIRHIAHQLGAGVLERVGLAPVLEELCNDIRSTNRMEVDFSVYGLEERLDIATEINVLRMVQELIGNALKYAKASQLSVQLNRINGVLSIMVEDNGIGFDTDAPPSKGAGLANVEKRVRLLNGSLQIEQRPGGGVTVMIELPDTYAASHHE